MPVSFNTAMRERFGRKIYKLALDGGFTCPNRDGTIDTRGCVFCSAGGSGDFAVDFTSDFGERLEQAKALVAAKAKDALFMPYFQAYTGTYAPVEKLSRLYRAAIAPDDVAAMSVATRPDCLPEDVLALLAEINEIKPVYAELGLQTIHEKTAGYIRRGYDLKVFDEAVEKLGRAGVKTAAHLILGLPGETREMMLESVRYVASLPIDGVKLQLLHVLRGTDLAADYLGGGFRVLELDEYAALVADCLRLLPEGMVVYRMTGDGAKKDLIAPLWSADKKRVLNTLSRACRGLLR